MAEQKEKGLVALRSELTSESLKEQIKEWKEQFESFKILDLENEDEYKVAKENWQMIRAKRLEVDKSNTGIKKILNETKNHVKSEYEKVSLPLKNMEEHLRNQMKRVENKKEEEKRKLREEMDQMLINSGWTKGFECWVSVGTYETLPDSTYNSIKDKEGLQEYVNRGLEYVERKKKEDKEAEEARQALEEKRAREAQEMEQIKKENDFDGIPMVPEEDLHTDGDNKAPVQQYPVLEDDAWHPEYVKGFERCKKLCSTFAGLKGASELKDKIDQLTVR